MDDIVATAGVRAEADEVALLSDAATKPLLPLADAATSGGGGGGDPSGTESSRVSSPVLSEAGSHASVPSSEGSLAPLSVPRPAVLRPDGMPALNVMAASTTMADEERLTEEAALLAASRSEQVTALDVEAPD
jgi:hypothetical protein